MSDELAKPAEESKGTRLFDKALKLIGIPLAALVGGAYGHFSLRDSVFTRLKKYGAFDDFIGEKGKLNKEGEMVSQGSGHMGELENLVSIRKNPVRHDIVEEMKGIHKTYGAQIKERMHEMGYKNTFKLWKGSHDTEKFEATLIAFTAAGITLGAVLALANTQSLFGGIFSKKDKESQNQTLSK